MKRHKTHPTAPQGRETKHLQTQASENTIKVK